MSTDETKKADPLDGQKLHSDLRNSAGSTYLKLGAQMLQMRASDRMSGMAAALANLQLLHRQIADGASEAVGLGLDLKTMEFSIAATQALLVMESRHVLDNATAVDDIRKAAAAQKVAETTEH